MARRLKTVSFLNLPLFGLGLPIRAALKAALRSRVNGALGLCFNAAILFARVSADHALPCLPFNAELIFARVPAESGFPTRARSKPANIAALCAGEFTLPILFFLETELQPL